jgi:hypothetical protein
VSRELFEQRKEISIQVESTGDESTRDSELPGRLSTRLTASGDLRTSVVGASDGPAVLWS